METFLTKNGTELDDRSQTKKGKERNEYGTNGKKKPEQNDLAEGHRSRMERNDLKKLERVQP